MKLTERTVLSYQDERSDKVYIAELYVDESGNQNLWTVVTSWGRRLSPRLSSQVKMERVIHSHASGSYNKIIRQKSMTGYVKLSESDLETFVIPGYNTTVRNKGYVNPIVQTRSASVAISKDISFVDTTYRAIK
jgi:predicted DNA-binding WGR domain protein